MNRWLVWLIFVGMWNLIMFLVMAAQQRYGFSTMNFVGAAAMFICAHFEVQSVVKRDEEKQ